MAYTNSSLVNYTRISPCKNINRSHSIDTVTVHCVVGQCSVETLGNIFGNYSTQASCNYGIGYDGRIGMYVEEKDRSWCTSSSSNDNRAITIEVASNTYHPYAVNAKAWASLVLLVADICRRNNIKTLLWKADPALIGKVSKQNLTVHRWFANKACPGDYLYKRHPQLVKEVNALLGSSNKLPTTPTTKPTTDSSNKVTSLAKGTKLDLKNTPLYVSATAKSKSGNRTGTYYIWSNDSVNNRIRITNSKSYVGKSGKVTGWITVANAKTAAGFVTVSSTKSKANKKVKEVQQWLNSVYYMGVEVDGIYGPYTKSALVKVLQVRLNKLYKAGLTADGIYGPATNSKIVKLSKGTNDTHLVRVLQGLLICNGYSTNGFDGVFGDGTKKAVGSYQKNNKLTVDYVAGTQTFSSLCK